MWVYLFVDNTRLFLKLFGACRNEGLQLVHHLAPGGAAGGLKPRVQALREVQAQPPLVGSVFVGVLAR